MIRPVGNEGRVPEQGMSGDLVVSVVSVGGAVPEGISGQRVAKAPLSPSRVSREPKGGRDQNIENIFQARVFRRGKVS